MCSGFSGKVGSSLEQRATIFVEVMIVIAVIGVLAFLIGLIVRLPQRQQAAANGKGQAEPSPRWYEFTLALILLAAIAAFAIWLISSGTHWVWGETIEDWRSDDRTITFAAVMVALAVVGLVVSLVYALVQSSQAPPREGGGAPAGRNGSGSSAGRRGAGAACAVAVARARLARFGGRDPAVVLDRAGARRAIWPDRATDLSGESRRDAGAAVRQGDADLERQAAGRVIPRMAVVRLAGIPADPGFFEPARRAEAGSLFRQFLGLAQRGAVLHRLLGHRPHRRRAAASSSVMAIWSSCRSCC